MKYKNSVVVDKILKHKINKPSVKQELQPRLDQITGYYIAYKYIIKDYTAEMNHVVLHCCHDIKLF